MQGKDISLLLLLKTNAQFSIPIYQRKYSWEETHCRKLFNSILKIAREPNREWHFLGSIIYLATQEEVLAGETTVFQVVDGQQRLTSMSLLLMALLDSIDNNPEDSNSDGSSLSKEELITYLVNGDCDEHDDRYLKIKLSDEDDKTYRKLWENRNLPEELKSSRVYKNYALFCQMINESNVSVEEIFKGIKKLKVINFSLKVSDNAQLVFETVNSTGLDLSVPDKVRNFVFMNENRFEYQQKYYDDLWHPIEINLNLVNDDNQTFNDFFKYYLTTVLKTKLSGDKYELYKDYFYQNKDKGVEGLIKEILQYSKHFSTWLNASNNSDDKIDVLLCELRDTSHWEIVPVVLQLLEDQRTGKASKDDVIKILSCIISYWMRRDLCDRHTNAAGPACISMLKYLGKDNYTESFINCLLTDLTYAQGMPTDEELDDKLQTVKLYQKKGLCRKVLDRIEMSLNKDYSHNSKHTIEHIMPETIYSHDELYEKQNLSAEMKEKKDWAIDLGENWQNIYEKYTHTIGNLTLSGYNSEYQNYRFSIKRDMQEEAEDGKKYGYKYTPINMSTSLASKEQWGEAEILERTSALSRIIKQLWPYPSTSTNIKQN